MAELVVLGAWLWVGDGGSDTNWKLLRLSKSDSSFIISLTVSSISMCLFFQTLRACCGW